MLMAFPPSLTIQPYLAKAQGMFPCCLSDWSARADYNSPLPYRCHAPCTSDAQGHVTECSRPWLHSTLQVNAPCMLQLNVSAECSANREHRQTDSLGGGNQYFAHPILQIRQVFIPSDVAKPFSRLSLRTDSKSWSAAAAHS